MSLYEKHRDMVDHIDAMIRENACGAEVSANLRKAKKLFLTNMVLLTDLEEDESEEESESDVVSALVSPAPKAEPIPVVVAEPEEAADPLPPVVAEPVIETPKAPVEEPKAVEVEPVTIEEPEPVNEIVASVSEHPITEEVKVEEPVYTELDEKDLPWVIAKDDVTYARVKIRVTDGPLEKAVSFAKVMPVSMKDGENRIIVQMIDENKKEVVKESNEKEPKISVRCGEEGEYAVNLTGKVENGKFTCDGKLCRKCREKGYSAQIIVQYNAAESKKGHIALEDEGMSLNIYPLGDRNMDNGEAKFYYNIDVDGKVKTGVSPSPDSSSLFYYNGTPHILTGSWREGCFVCQVKPLD